VLDDTIEGQGEEISTIDLLTRVNFLSSRVQELEKLLLTFRQAQLIMLGGSEDFLQMPRTVTPKHRR